MPTVDNANFPDNTAVSLYEIVVVVTLRDISRTVVLSLDLNAGAVNPTDDTYCRPPGSRVSPSVAAACR